MKKEFSIKYLNEDNSLLSAYINPEPRDLVPSNEVLKGTLHTLCCQNRIHPNDMEKTRAEVYHGEILVKTATINCRRD